MQILMLECWSTVTNSEKFGAIIMRSLYKRTEKGARRADDFTETPGNVFISSLYETILCWSEECFLASLKKMKRRWRNEGNFLLFRLVSADAVKVNVIKFY